MQKISSSFLQWLLLIAIAGNTFAQTITVKGKVTSNDNGVELPGVTVLLKGSTLGVITDANGQYSLNIPDNRGKLIFSFVGYTSQEIEIAGKTTIDAVLIPDVKSLGEVVVVGYGTQEKKDITGSVSQIATRQLEAIPVYNVEQALKARASGVQITQNSGTPGGRIEVRIRGGNSMIGSNNPLYVVDGFPISGGIEYLNPSDVESVDILKDASATAIYGARGANGVVLITSKRGRKRQKSKIEINSFYGIQQEIKRYKVLNSAQYAVVANEWLKNQNLPAFFNVSTIQGEGTDWQDVLFREAPIQNHTLSFTGGSETTVYSLSGNFYEQPGIIKNSSATRGNVRLNLNHDLNGRMILGVNLTMGRNELYSVPVDNTSFGAGAYSGALAAPPTLSVFDQNGLPTRIEQAYTFGALDMRNPVLYDRPRKDRALTNSVLGNTSLEFKIADGLTFKTLLGIEYQTAINESFTPIIFSDDRGSASDGYSYTNSFLNENVLNYVKKINEKHKFTIVGGITYQSYMNRFANASVSGLANNITENYNLESAAIITPPANGISEWKLLSGLGRVNYAFNDKYLFTASIRADGSSRFGANNKWGIFPSAAFAWRLSDEKFIKQLSFIYDLKLRTSYGITGNTALSPYQSLSRLNAVRTIYTDNTELVGYVPGGIANPDLKWETTAQFDAGFDLSVIKGALGFTFDYYKKNTTNLLASVPLPTSTGFSTLLQNVGEIENSGVELAMNATVMKKKFKWDVFAQLSANKNKIISLARGSDIIGGNLNLPFLAPANIARAGQPFGAFFGLQEDGLTTDGLVKYKDNNGDGTVNSLDRVILGKPNPDFIYSLNNTFSYQNFELNLFLEGVKGNQLFWATAGTFLNSYQRGQNQFADLYGNYWTKENPNPNAKYPKVSSATAAQISDRYVKDGSYLRVKSISVTYNIPVRKSTWLSKAQVYVSGTNLFTFTNYPGIDPEVNTTGTDSQSIGNRLLMGIDQGAYPSTKLISFGTRISF